MYVYKFYVYPLIYMNLYINIVSIFFIWSSTTHKFANTNVSLIVMLFISNECSQLLAGFAGVLESGLFVPKTTEEIKL